MSIKSPCETRSEKMRTSVQILVRFLNEKPTLKKNKQRVASIQLHPHVLSWVKIGANISWLLIHYAEWLDIPPNWWHTTKQIPIYGCAPPYFWAKIHGNPQKDAEICCGPVDFHVYPSLMRSGPANSTKALRFDIQTIHIYTVYIIIYILYCIYLAKVMIHVLPRWLP